jgi:peptidoglycan pentaglycine glycine transferase (the first glycine)
LEVRVLEDGGAPEFHACVRDSPFGDVLQTAAWGRLKAGSGWRAHFLTASEGGSVRGACLALERRLPRLPFSLLYCPRGPVLDWDSPDALAPLVAELRALARRRRAILVKIDPAVREGHVAAAQAIRACGFQPVRGGGFGGVQPRCVMKLDLTPGPDAILEGFKPKWRYNIRLAERKGVVVREAGKSEIDTFYDLLLETAKRDRFLVRDRPYFHSMWDELARDGMIRLFLAEYEGKALSGALLYILGKQAWYTYGASSNEQRNLMPNHLMQWAMIRASLDAGCTVYDFRGVSCNQDEQADDPLQGLNRFKAGFNAEFISYLGEYDLPVSGPLYFGWTRLAPAVLKLLKRRAAARPAEQPL